MRKPLIGVTSSEDDVNRTLFLRKNYAASVQEAGGIPVIVPYGAAEEDYAQLAEMLDGFLFSGGMDAQPSLFHEETLDGCGAATPDRDRMELILYQEILKRRKPILGICRGIQMMNVAQGGSLWQDIPKYFPGRLPNGMALAHQQPSEGETVSHKVDVTEGSLLYKLVGGKQIWVNSFHHQAVKEAAPGTIVTGRSSDGLIEALEMPGYGFWLGVQWHPEYMAHKDETAAGLFRGLIEAAKNYGI